MVTKYYYDKYFNIAVWVKLGGSCDAKVRGKCQKKSKVSMNCKLWLTYVFIKIILMNDWKYIN